MMITGLVAYLLANTAVANIVGTSIQPVPAPPNLADYPVVTYQNVSHTEEYANDGPVCVAEERVVLDCHAVRYLDARTLALAVATALSGFSGLLPDGTKVYLIEIVNVMDGFNGASQTLYRTSVHAMVQYAN